MDEISAHLLTARYPATRAALVRAAKANGAPAALVARLEGLECDRYERFEDVSHDLVLRRAEGNSALVAITAEACERCGFPRFAGEAHSCVEEKARFADSVNAVTQDFERFDESTIRQAASADLRSGEDRRVVDMVVAPADDRRHPAPRRRALRPSSRPRTSEADQGGERQDSE